MDKEKDKCLDLKHQNRVANLGLLTASICHEITNPVAYVRSNLEALAGYTGSLVRVLRRYQNVSKELETEGGEAIQQELSQISSSVDLEFLLDDLPQLMDESIEGINTIAEIVYGIRTFAKGGTLDKVVFDIHEAFSFVLRILRSQIVGRFILEEEYGDIPRVYGNEVQIKQVLLNLLRNAIQASSEGSRIGIHTAIEGEFVLVRVKDQGCGIAESELEKIFLPFHTSKGEEGTGLGLAICRDIVREHGGDLTVESQLGKGATFTLMLPSKTEEKHEL